MRSYHYRTMVVRETPAPQARCVAPSDVLPVIREVLIGCDVEGKEYFGAVYLSARHYVVGVEILSVGCLTASLVHPREVFRGAVILPCAALLVFHNHPSGDPEPSAEDVALTRRLTAAGSLLGIEVLDHVIVAGERYVSLRDRGVL